MKSNISSDFSYKWITKEPIKLSMDKTRLILFFLALNYLIVFLDVTIAHAADAFSPVYEWIPIIFCPLALLATLLLLFRPKPGLTKNLHIGLNVLGILIGILGFIFHLQGVIGGSAFTPTKLIGGNPVFAPLAFIALGSIGAITGMDDRPRIKKYGLTQKTRWLLIATAFWFLATALVAFFDHAVTKFSNFYTWFPVYIGFFAASVVFFQAFTPPDKQTSRLLAITMILSALVGLLGFIFHLSVDFSGGFSWRKVFYGAPGLAPLLFCDLGIWGGLVYLDPITPDLADNEEKYGGLIQGGKTGIVPFVIAALLVGLLGGKYFFTQTNSNQPTAGGSVGWVPPGQLDSDYMFASGGQAGTLVVWGIPSMRTIKTIPVFTPDPKTGFGFTPETKQMLGDKTWGDVHHPTMSQTQGTYDGKLVWINDKANNRIGQVDLSTFTTTQVLNIPNLVGAHPLSSDPDSKYLFTASEFSVPVVDKKPNYAPLSQWKDSFYGIAACVSTNRDAVQPGQPGKMSLNYEMLLPPYDYDLAAVGRGPSDGYTFFTAYNSEEATTDTEKNATAFDRDLTLFMDYKAAQKLIDAGQYDGSINGVKILDPRKHPGIAWLLPIPKNPHGVDISPDGKWICYSGKLDPVITVINIDKLKTAISNKDYETTTWGLPVIKYQDVQEAQVQVGIGPLHTQFDDQGYAYTSLFVESAITKWQLGTWQVIDKEPVNFNVGHLAVAGGDSGHPFGHWLVSLNKMSLNRFLPVGPGYPVSEQLFDLSGGPKMKLVNEAPSDREPHFASIIPANLIHPLTVYAKDPNRPNSVWNEDQTKVVRNGKNVTIYMTVVRSHFTPDNIELNQGDHVTLYLTNIEQQPNMTHGIAIEDYNLNVAADPGETVHVDFTADKAGNIPFYCADFCSALHEEMMGYFLIKPST